MWKCSIICNIITAKPKKTFIVQYGQRGALCEKLYFSHAGFVSART